MLLTDFVGAFCMQADRACQIVMISVSVNSTFRIMHKLLVMTL